MRDCENAEIRDRLPDLLHEGMDATGRSVLLAHVAGCADCAAELELLRGVRQLVHATAPAMDVGRILGAIAAPPAVSPDAPARARRTVPWGRRVGTGASLALAAGLGAMVMLRQDVVPSAPAPSSTPAVSEQAVIVAPPRSAGSPKGASVAAPDVRPMERELAVDAGLGDISDGALLALLSEIESLSALQIAEPDEPLPMPARETTTPGGGEER